MNLPPPSLAPMLAAACKTLPPELIIDHDRPQIIKAADMPVEVYHAQPSLSNSIIKKLDPDLTPVDFWDKSWMNPNREPFKVTTATKFGQAAHMLVLEGEDKFKANWNIAEGKKGAKSKTTTLEGHIAEEEYDTLMHCRDSLLSDPLASRVLNGAFSEVSMFCTIPVVYNHQARGGAGFMTRVPIRVRHDIWKRGYSADLKFVDSIEGLADVGRQIANYRYDHQAALYPRIMAICDPDRPQQKFCTIFVEKQSPYKVLVVNYDDAVDVTAHQRNDAAIERFAQLVMAHGADTKWPSFQPRVYTVSPYGEGNGDIELPQYWNYRK